MEILVSGLVETAGLEAAGNVVGPSRPLQWIGPGLVDEPDEELDRLLAGRDLIWTYELPWRHASVVDPSTPDPFDRWSSTNRRALNLRRRLGGRLTFVAIGSRGERSAYETALNRFVAIAMPEIGEVLSMLEASDRSGNAAEAESADDYNEILAELSRMLVIERDLRKERASNAAHEKRLADLLQKHQRLAVAESTSKRDASALTLALRDTQSELEQKFLEAQELGNELAKAKTGRIAAETSNQEFRKALDAARAALVHERELLAKERANSEHARAMGEALAVERALRVSLEEERALLFQRIEGMSSRIARMHSKMDPLESRVQSLASSWVPGRVRGIARRVFSGRVSQADETRQLRRIAECEWFDPDWYLECYPDVRLAGADPVEHYAMHGWKEGRDPGPRFNTLFYLGEHPDVKESGMNPLWHFLEFGQVEGRSHAAASTASGDPMR